MTMTLSEFKAWFEGFTECMEGAPDESQWQRIQARVKEISGNPVSYPVFVDRYVEPFRRYWPNVPYWNSSQSYMTAGLVDHGNGLMSQSSPSKANAFDSHMAMHDLGKAEYSAALSA
jgi:hypothetical protein